MVSRVERVLVGVDAGRLLSRARCWTVAVLALCCLPVLGLSAADAGPLTTGTTGTTGTAEPDPVAEATSAAAQIAVFDASLFAGVPATAVITVPTPQLSLSSIDLPPDTADVAFVELERIDEAAPSAAPGATTPQRSIIRLSFIPLRSGLLRIPAIQLPRRLLGDLPDDGMRPRQWQTPALQIQVAAAQRSPHLQLTVRPATNTVYVGQPLRVDVVWTCSIAAARLRQLQLVPSFMQRPDVEVVFPRSQVPTEQQVGLPVGGRRLVARRTLAEDASEVAQGSTGARAARSATAQQALGRVEFSAFIRMSEPGSYRFEPSTVAVFALREARGRFAPYAAHFNNALFEFLDPTDPCELLTASAEGFAVQVLALPAAQQRADYTGWFAPLELSAELPAEAAQLGQLMEVSVRVRDPSATPVPSNMLELPALAQRPGVRYRFWVDPAPRRIWHPDGAEFRVRVRPLTTQVRAFPALTFQVFNPTTGAFSDVTTAAQPLRVTAVDGQTVFDLSQLDAGPALLTAHTGGVWHNQQGTAMSDLVHSIIDMLADGWWWWTLGLVLLTAALTPVLRERQRLASDSSYRGQQLAYRAMQQYAAAPGAKAPLVLQHFSALIAACAAPTSTLGLVDERAAGLSSTAPAARGSEPGSEPLAISWREAEQVLRHHGLAAEDLATAQRWYLRDHQQRYAPSDDAADSSASATDSPAQGFAVADLLAVASRLVAMARGQHGSLAA